MTSEQSPELARAVSRVERAVDNYVLRFNDSEELDGIEARKIALACLAAAIRLAKAEGSYAAWLVLQECRARDGMELWDAIAHDAPAELAAARAACEAL